MTFTPGEWYIRGTRIMSPERDVFGNETTIVDCRGAMGGEDSEADKVLMCAAPKLFALLEEATHIVEGRPGRNPFQAIAEWKKVIAQVKDKAYPPFSPVVHLAADQDESNP